MRPPHKRRRHRRDRHRIHFHPGSRLTKGKTVLMYFADGEPTGLLVAEIRNWTGKVLAAPRSQLDQLSKREEVWRTGVYLPDGLDPADSSWQLVFVGESDIEESIIGSHPPVRKDLEGPASAGILAAWWASR